MGSTYTVYSLTVLWYKLVLKHFSICYNLFPAPPLPSYHLPSFHLLPSPIFVTIPPIYSLPSLLFTISSSLPGKSISLPAVRFLVDTQNVDISKVTATGPQGRLLKGWDRCVGLAHLFVTLLTEWAAVRCTYCEYLCQVRSKRLQV